MIGLGLGITNPRGVGFSPLSLFASGEAGAWYDPSNLSSLFQDSAGTTPVASSGDPVGLMLDKSGNDSHATQTVSDLRPTYQVDANGNGYLNFDGNDDLMDINPTVPSGLYHSVFAGLEVDGNGNNQALLSRDNSGFVPYAKLSGNGLGTYTMFDPYDQPPFIARFSANGMQPGGVTVDVNAGQYTGANSKSATASNYYSAITTSVASQYLTGKIFSLLIVSRAMTEEEVSLVNHYVASKTGVEL